MTSETQPTTETEEEEPELSPTAARAMRIVLWTVVAIMAAGWIFLFYNVLTRTLNVPPAPPPPVAKAAPTAPPKPAAPEKPAAPAPAKPDTPKPGPQPAMAIDTPSAGATVEQPFSISGWAVDRSATAGTGVDAVAIWAFPAGNKEGRLLGLAEYGGARPDLAPVLGERFVNSRYHMTISGLPAGQWTLFVFPHLVATKDWAQPPMSVAVTIK